MSPAYVVSYFCTLPVLLHSSLFRRQLRREVLNQLPPPVNSWVLGLSLSLVTMNGGVQRTLWSTTIVHYHSSAHMSTLVVVVHDVTHPVAGFCLKTKTDAEEKVFVNVCTSDLV